MSRRKKPPQPEDEGPEGFPRQQQRDEGADDRGPSAADGGEDDWAEIGFDRPIP